MIDLILKTPKNNDIIFSNDVSISYEVKDTEGVFNTVVFQIGEKTIIKNERIGLFSVKLPKGSHNLFCYITNKLNKEILSTRRSATFTTEPITVELKNKLSSVVSSTIPDFLEQDYEVFIEFIKQYYKWLEQTNNVNYIPHSLELYFDIDTIPIEFLDKFKETYLVGMPNKFAKDSGSGADIDLVKIIKNIKDFYSKKGTEDSFRFLFRIMFDTEITLSYPREKIFYSSQGKWKENNIIKIKTTSIENATSLIGKEIYILGENNNTKIFSAIIDEVFVSYVKEKTVITATISNIVGALETNFVSYQEYVQGNLEEKTLELYSVVVDYSFTGCDETMSTPSILGIGQKFDFVVGQKIYLELIPDEKEFVCLPTCLSDITQDLVVDGDDLGRLLADWGSQNSVADLNKDGFVDGNDLGILLGDWGGCPLCVINLFDSVNRPREVGSGFFAIVDKVNEKGEITAIKILDCGVNYTPNNITRYSTKIVKQDNSGSVSYDCRLTYKLGYIFKESGKYVSKKSLLSELNILQDNFYYQQNSYEIGASSNPTLYADLLKQHVHPAGYQAFYKYDILEVLDNSAKINFNIEQY